MAHTPNVRLTRVADTLDIGGNVVDPLTLADAKNFLRVEITDDDALITDLITAAKLACEQLNNRSFIDTTWQLVMDYFPPYAGRYSTLLPPALVGAQSDRNYWLNLSDQAINLPMPPLVSVSSISYVDPSGTTQTLDPSSGANNVRITTGTPGLMTPAYGKIFPVTQPVLGAVIITYVCGYGTTQASVPRNVVAAMRFLVAHYYENRTADIPVPEVVQKLLDPTYWGSYT